MTLGSSSEAVLAARVSQGAETRNERRFYLEWLALACLSLACVVWSSLEPVWPAMGQAIYDGLHRLHPAAPNKDIVIVAIDDQSLHQLGGWPLSRSVYGDFLKVLADTHNEPRSIGFDILFLDPRAEDAQVAAQIRRHHVVMPVEMQVQGADRHIRSPVAAYANAARQLGHIQVSFESDGVLRGVHLQDHDMPHLVLAMAQRSLGDTSDLGHYRRFRLVDPAQGFETISLADVLLARYPLSALKDKYVLIGATAPSLGDHYPTVYAGRLSSGSPGVEMHANALNALLRDQLITQAPQQLQLGLGVAAVLVVLLALLMLGPLAQLLTAAGVMLGLLLVSQWCLTGFNWWFDPSSAWIVIALVKPAWAWRRTEMTVHFMRQRAEQLESQTRAPGFNLNGGGGGQQVTDAVMRYTRILDQALHTIQLQLDSLSAIVQGAPNAMLVVNEMRRIVMFNPRMRDLWPEQVLIEGEAVGGVLQILGWRADQDLGALTGRDHHVSCQQGDQDRRHYLCNVIEMPAESGGRMHLLSLLDITEIRALEAQRERTLSLLSHDMRTPVASILALATNLDAVAQAGFQRHAQTLLGMMDDFILSIQAQDNAYALSETLFDELLDEALYQVKDLAKSKAMPIECQSDGSAVFVMAAPRLFTRVLVNLLVNAVRHGQPGSTIEIHVQTCRNTSGQDSLRCQIRNRIGSAHSHGTPAVHQGFGLGTGFVADVVRKHHGHVELDVAGSSGDWASVTLTLPVAAELGLGA